MPKIISNITGQKITLPYWNDGFTKKEYEQLVRGLKQACDSNIDDFDSQLSHAIDDIVVNLELFQLGSYYEQAYEDIQKHNELQEEHIARIDSADSPEEHLMYNAGELLARDIEGRILNERSN